MARGGRSIASMTRKELIELILSLIDDPTSYSSTLICDNGNILEDCTIREQDGASTRAVRPAVLIGLVTVSSGNRLTVNSNSELDIRS